MARVLQVVSSSDRRGAEIFAVALAARLDELGHQVQAVALAPGGEAPLPVRVLGTGRFAGALSLPALARRHDVVVSNGGTTLLPVAVAALVARRPFVYRNIGDPAAWGSVRFADLRIGRPLRRAAAVAALSPDAAQQLRGRYRLHPDRVTIIPNAVEAGELGPTDAAQRRVAADALGLDPALRWVACLGALSAEKDPEAAIRAIAAAPELGLVLAGDGPLRARCEELAASTAPDRVRVLGQVRDPAEVLRSVEALVLPSRTEGLPAVAIEAGLCALPVVATAVGGVPFVVDDGVTGILVPDATTDALVVALRAALADGDQLGRAARRRCEERFTMDAVVGPWDQLLTRVAAGGRR